MGEPICPPCDAHFRHEAFGEKAAVLARREKLLVYPGVALMVGAVALAAFQMATSGEFSWGICGFLFVFGLTTAWRARAAK